MITRILRQYLSRFRWEIAAFWLLSAGNSAVLGWQGSLNLISTLSMLEIVGLAWITVRIVLADDGFKMNGGWRTRPSSVAAQHLVPLGIAAVAVIVPALLRAMAFQRLFGSGGDTWTTLLCGCFLPLGAAWLSIAGALKLFGMTILRGAEGRAKAAAWTVLAVILLPVMVRVCGNFRVANRSLGRMASPGQLSQGIQRQLPNSRGFIGAWNDTVDVVELSEAKCIGTISLAEGTALQGVNIRSMNTRVQGARVRVEMQVLMADPKQIGLWQRAVPVLRYADGTYGSCVENGSARSEIRTPLVSAVEWRFTGDFVSPLSQPGFDGKAEDLTQGLELLFFDRDAKRPKFKGDPLYFASNGEEESLFLPQTVADLFERFPWGDQAWAQVVRPFLIQHATREDLPKLSDAMEFDTRLFSVFAELGWKDDAMPVLRRLAKERLPMELDAVLALADEHDPSLDADLMALALLQDSGLKKLETVLRARPGFDWLKFVREAWRRRKYSTDWGNPQSEPWIAAAWAAQEGDFTAFRHTAEWAASGNKWEIGQLPALVVGEHADLIGYLRENIDRMKYDPATRKWGM